MSASQTLPEGHDTDRTGNDAANVAYHVALDLILRGDLNGGEWLREESVAQLAGVSRTPVRQAINRLSSEGVLHLSRNKGAQVISLTDEDAHSLLALRSKFEPYAAGLSVAHLTDGDFQELAELHDRMERMVGDGEVNPIRMGQLNNEFHSVFIQKCGSTYLTNAIQSLVMPALVARTFGHYKPAALRRSMQHHEELLAAARVRDAEWVEAVMRTHILAARHASHPK